MFVASRTQGKFYWTALLDLRGVTWACRLQSSKAILASVEERVQWSKEASDKVDKARAGQEEKVESMRRTLLVKGDEGSVRFQTSNFLKLSNLSWLPTLTGDSIFWGVDLHLKIFRAVLLARLFRPCLKVPLARTAKSSKSFKHHHEVCQMHFGDRVRWQTNQICLLSGLILAAEIRLMFSAFWVCGWLCG